MGRISTRLDAWIFPRSNPRWLMQRLYFASNHAVGIYIYIKMRFPRKYLLPLMASIYASPVSCYTTSRYLARIKLHAIYFPGCCELCVRDRGREQRCVVSEREFFFFVIFFRSWFSGEMERRMNEIRFVFRFMNLDNRVAFVWSLCDFFFLSFSLFSTLNVLFCSQCDAWILHFIGVEYFFADL